MLVWHHIGVVLRSDLDRGDAEVSAHLEDLLRGGTGGCSHPEDQPTGDLLVRRGDVDVGVIADRAVGFVEHDQADVVQGDPLRPQVVPDPLRRRDDDLVLPPQEFSILGRGRLAGEERDPVDDQDVPHRCGVLLDEGLRRSEEEDPTAAAPQDLRFPGGCRDLVSLKLLHDLQHTVRAVKLCARRDVLPGKQEAHEVGRGHGLDFFSQPA